MRLFLVVLVLFLNFESSECRIYDRCSLVREFFYVHALNRQRILQWICIVDKQTGLNTSQVTSDSDGSQNHGLFQLNDKYWCLSASQASWPNANVCKLPCSALSDDRITDDVMCASRVFTEHGTAAWPTFEASCKNWDLSVYINGCHI